MLEGERKLCNRLFMQSARRSEWLWALSWLGALGLASCGVSDPELAAWMTASANGHGTVELRVTITGGELGERDQVVASIGDRVERLAFAFDVFYREVFRDVDPGALEIIVGVDRESGPDAPRSVVTVPEGFALDLVVGEVSRSSDLTVTWSLAGTTDFMEWTIETNDPDMVPSFSHIIASGVDEPDTGMLTIPAGRLAAANEHCGTGPCELVLWMDRIRRGRVGPAFAGGQTKGAQKRVLKFVSVP